jgi:hypothetical protein
MATPAGIQISAAGVQLNMNSTKSDDNIGIPAPTGAGWVFTCTGTGLPDGGVQGENGSWNVNGRNIPTENLAGIGNWVMTAAYNSGANATCSWNNDTTTVSYTATTPNKGSQMINDTITCTGGGN